MLTQAEQDWFARRDDLTPAERAVLESVLNDLGFSARVHRVPVAYDDRAGALESAVVRYLIESRPAH